MAHIGLAAFAVRHERLQFILKTHGGRILGRLRRTAARPGGTLLEALLPRRITARPLLTRLLLLRLFDGQVDAPGLIDVDDLYLDLLPFLQKVCRQRSMQPS